jgi:GT2 family glycosyltransferase
MTPSRPAFASFVVTYNRPDPLRATLERLLSQTQPAEVTVVIDNGTGDEGRTVAEEFGHEVEYVHTGDNLGSAGGAACGMELLFDRGYEWIHSVDDDNPTMTDDTLERLRSLITRNDDDSLAAVAVGGTRWDWSKGRSVRIPNAELTGDLAVDSIGGNQHMTTRRQVIAAHGTPRKEFFFGFWDALYSLRLRRAGYRLMIDGTLLHEYRTRQNRLDHQLSRSARPRDPYGSIWRRYYVTRNYIYEMRNALDRPDLARRQAVLALGRAITSWTRGARYGARYSNLQLRGVVDGYRGRLGRTVPPRAKSDGEG